MKTLLLLALTLLSTSALAARSIPIQDLVIAREVANPPGGGGGGHGGGGHHGGGGIYGRGEGHYRGGGYRGEGGGYTCSRSRSQKVAQYPGPQIKN